MNLGPAPTVDRHYIFNEILKWIKPLGCYYSPESLHDFVLSRDCSANEYRLTGRYGFGFKLHKRVNVFYFDQYKEEETVESLKWIDEHNILLEDLSQKSNQYEQRKAEDLHNYRNSPRYQELLRNKPDVMIIHRNDAGPWYWSIQIQGSEEWIDSFDTLPEAEGFCSTNGLKVLEFIS